MKTGKKILAVLLSILTVFSTAAISASAEEKKSIGIMISSVQVTKFAEGDPETVTQLEMKLRASDPDVVFDTLNGTDAFPICEGYYAAASFGLVTALGEFDGVSDGDYYAKAMEITRSAAIGTVKPAAFADGVLTLDVFAADGTPGMKMVTFSTMSESETINAFIFVFPEGLLKDSRSGKVNSECDSVRPVQGLAVRPLGLPGIAKRAIQAIMTNDYARLLVLLPIVIVILPVLLVAVDIRFVKAFSGVYDLDYSGLMKRVYRSIPQILKYLLTVIF